MKRIAWLGLLTIVLAAPASAFAQHTAPNVQFMNVDAKGKDEFDFISLCRRLKGRIVDHTANHGKDNRIWSRSMFQWRDLYIYLPPNYDPKERYPIIMYLHPFALDERTFLHMAPALDDAMCKGKLPPAIVVAPDGSLDGKGCFEKPGSFFLNSNAGAYEDFVMLDVWDFVVCRYPIRPEREAHVLAGISMGGFAAFNLGMRHRDAFGIVMGIHPPLNLRWADVDGNPRAKFDPRRWGWRTGFDNPNEVIASFGGAYKVKLGPIVRPVFGVGDEALLGISYNNPLELLMNSKMKNCDLSMFVGYGGRDEYNIDAQVDSFLYYCKFKGIGVAVAFEPDGRHDGLTVMKLMPAAMHWLAPQLAPYAPRMGCETEIWPAVSGR
jgi:hypothetical protein